MTETERHFPCESCGADLRFAPGDTALRCDHCGHVQQIPAAPAGKTLTMGELDLHQALAKTLPPGAMEEVLASHPNVAECAVIGMHDALKGEVPCGFVVLKAGVNKRPDEVEKELVALVREKTLTTGSMTSSCRFIPHAAKTSSSTRG